MDKRWPGKRQLLTPSLFRHRHEGQLREQLRTENLDAEDLLVRQVQLAGRVPDPFYSIRVAIYYGGELVWSETCRAEIEGLMQDTLAGYEIADAVPFCLDFPIQPLKQGNVARYERFFAAVLLGPRLAIVERGAGRYVVTPIDAGDGKPQ